MKVAFKGISKGEWTIVTAIEPRCTRTGNVIPQVYVQQVIVEGSTISTIAGANYNVLIERDIRIGSKVYVIKANEVIPYIEKVDNTNVKTIPIVVPTN